MKRWHRAIQCAPCVVILFTTHSRLFALETRTPPRVEFVTVKGSECLQAIVNASNADRNDFRRAESQWLELNYPGRPAPRGETVASLAAASDVPAETVYVDRDTFYVQAPDGSEVAVCFDIHRTFPYQEPRSGDE